MTTSAEDLGKFTTAFLNGKIIKDTTRAEMLRPVLKVDTLAQFGPGANEGNGKEPEGVGLAYGSGGDC